MNCRTYELYDENEYFLKYLNIHPILTYSDKELDKVKKELQITLLNKFNNELISYEDLQKIYEDILKIENNNKNILYDIQEQHKEIEEKIHKNIENNLIIYFKQLNKEI